MDPLWPDLLQSIVIEAIIFAIFAILDYNLSHNFQAKKTLANKEILSLNTLVFLKNGINGGLPILNT